MATFFYGLACVFNQAGNSANFSQNDTQVPLTGTVEDDGADTTFSVNEAVTDPGFETLFPDYLGPPADPEPTVVGSFDTGSDVWLVVLVPNSSPNASGQSGNDNLVFYGPSGADKSLLPGPRTNITIENDIDQNDVPECFAAGTLIQTPSGEQKVEDLAIGDLIMTAENKPVAVKWIGRQTIVYGFMGGGLAPVRIMAGALCDERPHTDLLVTADHGIIVDGLVITASSLINGVTIVLEPLVNLPPRMTYYHIELEGHDAIYANGAIAETYVDYRTRQGFDNYREYVGLYGGQQTIREMELPRISTARLVPQTLRTRLAIMAD